MPCRITTFNRPVFVPSLEEWSFDKRHAFQNTVRTYTLSRCNLDTLVPDCQWPNRPSTNDMRCLLSVLVFRTTQRRPSVGSILRSPGFCANGTSKVMNLVGTAGQWAKNALIFCAAHAGGIQDSGRNEAPEAPAKRKRCFKDYNMAGRCMRCNPKQLGVYDRPPKSIMLPRLLGLAPLWRHKVNF